MKYEQKNNKLLAVSFFVIMMASAFILLFFQERMVNKHFQECSLFTVANITKVYKVHGTVRAIYLYNMGGKTIEFTTSVGPFDTNEWWSIDMNKLKRRKLMLIIYCKNFKENRVLWDVAVPDTLQYIPLNGWDKIPYGLDKIEAK